MTLSAKELKSLEETLVDAMECGELTDWEVSFVEGLMAKFERYGAELFMSEKQWAIIERLDKKMNKL